MPKEVVKLPSTPENPRAHPAVKAGDYIYVTGQTGAVDDKGNPIKGAESQTRQLLENMKKILEAAGASFDDMVKTTVFLVNVEDFAAMNKAYESYFTKDRPARSTIIVAGLAYPEWLVEIEAVAYCPRR
jgi:2-iminobutanoate/2-iminopropanoate deaminase